MLPIPDDVLRAFDAFMEKKSVPQRLRPDYRKWLRYFLDFRAKYQPPDSRSEQVRLFIEKLRSKGQSPRQQAAAALSLFFAMQPLKKHAVQSLAGALERNASKPRPQLHAVSAPSPVVGGASGRGRPAGGKRYNEWRCLERTKSPEWDAVIDRLETEITMRHYSRKTLKTYADWIRKFQSYLRNKPPLDLSACVPSRTVNPVRAHVIIRGRRLDYNLHSGRPQTLTGVDGFLERGEGGEEPAGLLSLRALFSDRPAAGVHHPDGATGMTGRASRDKKTPVRE